MLPDLTWMPRAASIVAALILAGWHSCSFDAVFRRPSGLHTRQKSAVCCDEQLLAGLPTRSRGLLARSIVSRSSASTTQA